VGRWLDRRERIDELMERLPRNLTGIERARCQHLVFGVVRHEGRLNAALGRLVPRPPRLILRAILYVAGYELLEAGLHPDGPAGGGTVDSGLVAKVVHHAVERAKTLASPAEARLVNAVVRKLAGALAAQTVPPRLASAGALAEYFSHPEWLVGRWLAQFGADATRALLEWNQQPAPVYARWRTAEPTPAWLAPTRGRVSSKCRRAAGPRWSRCSRTGNCICRIPRRASRSSCWRRRPARRCSICARRRAASRCRSPMPWLRRP
jgi:16S rRNA (cytosine967-C5)-methyltransferase